MLKCTLLASSLEHLLATEHSVLALVQYCDNDTNLVQDQDGLLTVMYMEGF